MAPGVGVLWFAARREWRQLAIAVGVTAAVTAASLALAPGAWADFVRFAIANAGAPSPLPLFPVPFAVRLPLVIVAVAWAARTNRPWIVVVAAGFATPALYTWTWMTIAAAGAALWWRSRTGQPQVADACEWVTGVDPAAVSAGSV